MEHETCRKDGSSLRTPPRRCLQDLFSLRPPDTRNSQRPISLAPAPYSTSALVPNAETLRLRTISKTVLRTTSTTARSVATLHLRARGLRSGVEAEMRTLPYRAQHGHAPSAAPVCDVAPSAPSSAAARSALDRSSALTPPPSSASRLRGAVRRLGTAYQGGVESTCDGEAGIEDISGIWGYKLKDGRREGGDDDEDAVYDGEDGGLSGDGADGPTPTAR
ncbi:hypothetical protein B0H15DRAFT_954688 [Mycena belliarum]|uniref:Uncharacterized protein n=1 Tax=Mycena belliarum TaxID=1033014 RepID=A0AAD6TXU2_9AGAR|nr:hypothetical protein B0H15DRAFT_954688 [Mycena belliae]